MAKMSSKVTFAVVAAAAVASAKNTAQADVMASDMKFDKIMETYNKDAFEWRKQYLEDSELLASYKEGAEQAVKNQLEAQERVDFNIKKFHKEEIQAAIEKVEKQIKEQQPKKHFIAKAKAGPFTAIKEMIGQAYKSSQYIASKEAMKKANDAVEAQWQKWYKNETDKSGQDKADSSMLAKDEAYLQKKREYERMAKDRTNRMGHYKELFGQKFVTAVNDKRALLRQANIKAIAAEKKWADAKEELQKKKTEKAKADFESKTVFPAQKEHADAVQQALDAKKALKAVVKKATDGVTKPLQESEIQVGKKPVMPKPIAKGLKPKAKAKAQAKRREAMKKYNAALKAYDEKTIIVYEACLYYGTCGDEEVKEMIETAGSKLAELEAEKSSYFVNVAKDNEAQAKLENEERVAQFSKDLLKSLEKNEKLMASKIEDKQKGLFREFQTKVELNQVQPLRELIKELGGEETQAALAAKQEAERKQQEQTEEEKKTVPEQPQDDSAMPVWLVAVLVVGGLAFIAVAALLIYRACRTEEIDDDL